MIYFFELSEDIIFQINNYFKIIKVFVRKGDDTFNNLNKNYSYTEDKSFLYLIHESHRQHAEGFLKKLSKRGKSSEELIFQDKKEIRAWFEVNRKKLMYKSEDSAVIYLKNLTKFKTREENLIKYNQSLNSELNEFEDLTSIA